jgi:DNA (cytosine-5)-methyltransferase 1
VRGAGANLLIGCWDAGRRKMVNNKFALFSLFSGAGGMDLGFLLNGSFDMLFANDILSPPVETYAYNFRRKIVDVSEVASPNFALPACVLGDVSEIDFSKIRGDEVDVVIGGPPCQDFSIVRGPEKERQGLFVKRGRLYAHFVRALVHLSPKVFVFENVPGLKSANRNAAYKTIIEDFAKLNLRWEEVRKIAGNSVSGNLKNYLIIFSDVVDSAHLGVPQKRRRLIIIGAREDLFRGDWAALSGLKQRVENILLGRNSIFRKYPLTPLEVFEGKPLQELCGEYREIMQEYRDVINNVETERAFRWRKEVWEKLSFEAVEDYLKLNGIVCRDENEIEEAFKAHAEILKKLGYYGEKLEGKYFSDKSNTVSKESEDVLARLKMIPPDENHMFVRGTKWEVEGRGMSLIYRRIHPLKPSYTIVAYGGGGTWGYHYRRCRGKLTNRERARLQTFPDWFLFRGSEAEVRAQIGEAVPPFLGQKVAEAVEIILRGGA